MSLRVTRRRVLGGMATSAVALAIPGLGGVAFANSEGDIGSGGEVVGYLYTDDNTTGTNTIAGFARRADGTLAPLPGSPFSIGGAGNGGALPSQGALALSSDRRYLLAVDAASDQISVARIGAGGRLWPVAGSPFGSRGHKPVSISVHGGLVYVANAGDGGANYAGFWQRDDGRLMPLPRAVYSVPDGAGIGQVLVDPTGQHLIGIRVNTSLIDSFTIGDGGRLTPAPGSPFMAQAAGPFGSKFRPGANPPLLFVSNAHAGAGMGSVSAFRVSSNGTLSPVAGSPYYNGQTATCWVTLSPGGTRLFAANTGSSTITSYRVTSSGALAMPESFSLHGGSDLGIFDLATDPAGHFLYQLEGGAKQVAALAVRGGSLSELGSSPFALPTSASAWGIVVI